MVNFCLLAALQFVMLAATGLAASLSFWRRTIRPLEAAGWIALAPALGVTISIFLAMLLQPLGVSGRLIFVAPALLGALFAARASGERRGLPMALLALLAGFAIVTAFNVADIAFAGLGYFPLTNDDTFSYLGLIDQVRMSDRLTPAITYPAGFHPIIEGAVDLRAASGRFVANWADAFGIDTRIAFFVTQRVVLPVVVLGACGVVLIASGSALAAGLCLAALTFGNALLHQVLQQFNSSSLGTMVGTVAIAAMVWAVRDERSRGEAAAGWFTAGFATGVMALASYEAHPFYLAGAGLCLSAMMLRRQAPLWMPLVGLVGYLCPTGPMLVKIWLLILAQYAGAAAMSAKSIAVPGFLIFLSGVSLDIPPDLTRYSPEIRIVAFSTIAAWIGAIGFLTARGCLPAPRAPQRHTGLVLGLLGLLFIACELIMYARGIGYGLQKLADYFAFLGAVTVSVALAQIHTASRLPQMAALLAVAVYSGFGARSKVLMLANYRGETMKEIPADPAKMTMEQFNLTLYNARLKPEPITIPPGRSNRYAN